MLLRKINLQLPFTIWYQTGVESGIPVAKSSAVASFAVSNPSSDLLSPLGDTAEILRCVTVFVPAIILVGGMLSAGNAGASAGVNRDNWPGSEHLTTTGHLLHAGGP